MTQRTIHAGLVAWVVFGQIAVWLIITHVAHFGLLCLTVVFFCGVTATHWSLIHEAIHGNLFVDRKANEAIARVLSILLLSSFAVLRFGHLLHHRFNRTDYETTEAWYCGGSWLLTTVIYYARLMFGLYAGEMLLPLLLWLPKSWVLATARSLLGAQHPFVKTGEKTLLSRRILRQVRIDALLMVCYFLVVSWLSGQSFALFMMLLLFRGVQISLADNLPHYGGHRRHTNSAYNMRCCRLWQACMLNFNYHEIHHRYPQLPWYQLPAQFDAEGRCFDMAYYQQWLRQFFGIISVQQLDKQEEPSIDSHKPT